MSHLDDVEDIGNVLVTDASTDREQCADLLTTDDPSNCAELTVSLPNARAGETGFESQSGTTPVRRAVISVGDVGQSSAGDGPDVEPPVSIDAVADPGDLQSICTSVTRFCERWTREGYDVVVCFDSLTELLGHADVAGVFRFCQVLGGRLTSIDALSHFHLDPAEHEAETVATFQSIFDETVGETTDADAIEEFVEATDDDVAALADGWDQEANYSIVGDGRDERPDEVHEASDQEIADSLQVE
ncbi:DUF7504 family protein [Haloarchaeobius sp. HRN-SO-5]|uniref:DUF7504 family protein n=1 Tax=Haloarchaeobius sp. HRN-SO-5 TaxID=3446118 RepID=UPI003EC13B60